MRPPLFSCILACMNDSEIETEEQNIEITSDQIESWYPMIAVPCYDQQVTEPFFMSMMKTVMQFKEYGLNFAVSTVSDSLITRGRNSLVAKFLANPEFTHLMFIDADIGFDPADIMKMLWHDKDIITGSYPIKNIDWDKISSLVKSGEPTPNLMSKSLRYVVNPVKGRSGEVIVDNGAIRIYDAGTGFMLIKREVFLKLIENYPNLRYKDDTGSLSKEEMEWTYNLFSDYIDEDGRLLSEDYGFCRFWQNIGGEVWVDPAIDMLHLGRMRYSGRMLDFLQTVAKPTPE